MTGPEEHHSAPAWKRVGGFFLDWAKSLGLYAAIVAAGTFLFLIGSSFIGYLAYSDRPGPGWGRGVFSWGEERFFLSWLPLLIRFLLFSGAVLFPFARLLGWFHSPRWIVRVFGGIFAGVAALIGVMAAGWYIAISQYPVYAGAICGIIYGAFLLPHFSGLPRGGPTTWKQWAGTLATIVAFGAVVVYPLMPMQPEQTLDVRLVRVVPGPQTLGADGKTGSLTVEELNQLKSLGITGSFQPRSFGMSESHGSSVRASTVIVCTGDLHSPVELREPQATHVMYVQQGDTWKMYPPSAPTLKSKIKLWPSARNPGMIEVQSGSSHGPLPPDPPQF